MMRFFGDVQGWLYGGATAELKGLAPGFDTTKLVVAMSIAALFGMAHAFMPGHGKTVIVSYYLGRPARYLGSIGMSAILVLSMSVPQSSWFLPGLSCSAARSVVPAVLLHSKSRAPR